MSAPGPRGSRRTEPLRSPFEASPELRLHKIERARFVRRLFAVPVGLVLVAAVAWAAWGVWAVRAVSTRAQSLMRADKAAMRRLDAARADITLLVLRSESTTSAPQVAIVREPADTKGSWILALPAANVPASDAASETPGVLLSRGRATLIKAVEGLLGSNVGHLIEIDQVRLARALPDAGGAGGAGRGATVGAIAESSQSPSATVATFVGAAQRYEVARTRRLALLSLPSLAHSLVGAAVSDMGATQIDAFLRRLGADVSSNHVWTAVVPVTSAAGVSAISASAARTLGAQMLAGSAFSVTAKTPTRVAPGSVSVSVLNGAGREGVAAQAVRILRRAGYRINDKNVGNANQFVYDKTLIVYTDKRAAADAVARDLKLGKVIASRGMYAFTTNVLVIVGSDWPQAP